MARLEGPISPSRDNTSGGRRAGCVVVFVAFGAFLTCILIILVTIGSLVLYHLHISTIYPHICTPEHIGPASRYWHEQDQTDDQEDLVPSAIRQKWMRRGLCGCLMGESLVLYVFFTRLWFIGGWCTLGKWAMIVCSILCEMAFP